MAKLRIENRYWIAPNALLNHKEISFKAKWLFTYIQSKPADWDFSVHRIKYDTKEWVDWINNWLKELEKLWYLTRKKYQDENWHWQIEYILTDNPNTGNPNKANPDKENPNQENQQTKKERNTKKEISNKEKETLSKDKGENSLDEEQFLNNKKHLIWKITNLKNNENKKEKKVPAKKEKYWNADINQIIDIIKKYNSWLCAGTQKEQRQYWKLLLTKLEKFTKDWFNKFNALDIMIDKIKDNKYHNTKIVWPKKIYYSFEELVQIIKWDIKNKNKTIIF